ncbi:MAG TPA: hypothetical protein VGI45_35125 [Terracidiphilus sp.]
MANLISGLMAVLVTFVCNGMYNLHAEFGGLRFVFYMTAGYDGAGNDHF